MGVPQYTTPTFTLTFTEAGLDLAEAANVYVTFKSGVDALTKTGDALTVAAKSITVHLTQQETARFAVGDVMVQANWVLPSGDRVASEIVKVSCSTNLLAKVMA